MPTRTTLTLEDDVAEMLKKAAARRGVRAKVIVNELLREGLSARKRPKRPRKVHVKTVDLGRCLFGDITDISTALALAEGDGFG